MKDFLLMKMTTIYYVKYKTKTDFRNIEIELQKSNIALIEEKYINIQKREVKYYH